MFTTPVFTPYSGNMGPLTRVSPFTHRDNNTFTRILYEIIEFINKTLQPEMNAELERILTKFQDELDAASLNYNTTQAEWLALFNAMRADLEAQIAILNDGAVGLLVTDALSATSEALDVRYRTQWLTTATGNGATNDTATLTADAARAVALGLELVLNGSRTYAVDGLVLPAGLRLITNGAKFKKLVNSGTYAIKTPADFTADSLNLEVTGGAVNEAGIFVGGSNTRIDAITVTSLTADQPGANALFVGDLNPLNKRSNIRVNNITLTGFKSPMRVVNVGNSRFSNGILSNFMTGVYVVDCTDTVFDKFEVKGTSPSSTGSNGQNGFLIEAQSADWAVSNLRLLNCIVDGAPEHSYRVGGSLSCVDIAFENCLSRNPGNAPGNTATGGGGFKALGGDPAHWHYGIKFINCVAEDSNTGAAGINNFTQFAFGFVDGLQLINPVVRKRFKQFSAHVGMFLNAMKNVQVINADFRDTKTFCVFIGKDGTNVTGDGVSNVKFTGGNFHSANTHAFSFAPDTVTVENIYLDNVNIIGNVVSPRGLRCDAVGAGGVYSNVHLGVTYELKMATGAEPPLITPVNGVLLNYRGPVYGYTMSAEDGSTIVNRTTGAFWLRKAGNWSIL